MKKRTRYKVIFCLLVLCLLLCCGCKKPKESTAAESALNIFINMDESTAEDFALVNEAFDAYVYEKLGFHAQLISSADYFESSSTAAEEESPIDITSVPLFSLQQMSASDQLLPLDELLEAYGQELLNAIDSDAYAFLNKDGPLYGLPTNGEHCRIQGFEYNQEIADQYGLDLSGVSTAEDLTPIFAELQEKAPDISPILIKPSTYSCGQVDYMDDGFGVLTEDSGSTVVNLYETEEYVSLMKLFYAWQQSGYVLDYLQDGKQDTFYLASGQVFGTLTSGKVGFAEQETKNVGYQMGFIPLSDPYSTSISQSTFWYALPTTCRDPEKAMQLLNLMYTDPTVANLVMYGIEDVHYQRLSEDSNIITYADGATDSGYGGPSGWAYCNQYIAYIWEGYSSDIWEQTEAVNQTATRSPALGFRFDSSAVSDQIFRCNKVCEKYTGILCQGLGNPDELLPALQQELKDAGIDDIIAEKQRQLNLFLQDTQ